MKATDLGDAGWRKSTRSSATGQCTEVACLGGVTWRKSSRSSATGACTEVASLGAGVAVRDSKDPAGPALLFSPAAWRAFTDGLRSVDPHES